MAPSADNLIEWVETVVRDCVNLTEWEESFIERMHDRISLYGDKTRFTEAEGAKIEEIYSERTS